MKWDHLAVGGWLLSVAMGVSYPGVYGQTQTPFLHKPSILSGTWRCVREELYPLAEEAITPWYDGQERAAVESAAESTVKPAVECTVESTVEATVESTAESAIESAVESAVGSATESGPEVAVDQGAPQASPAASTSQELDSPQDSSLESQNQNSVSEDGRSLADQLRVDGLESHVCNHGVEDQTVSQSHADSDSELSGNDALSRDHVAHCSESSCPETNAATNVGETDHSFFRSGYDPIYDATVYGVIGPSAGIAASDVSTPDAAACDQQACQADLYYVPFDGEPESFADYCFIYGNPGDLEDSIAPNLRVYAGISSVDQEGRSAAIPVVSLGPPIVEHCQQPGLHRAKCPILMTRAFTAIKDFFAHGVLPWEWARELVTCEDFQELHCRVFGWLSTVTTDASAEGRVSSDVAQPGETPAIADNQSGQTQAAAAVQASDRGTVEFVDGDDAVATVPDARPPETGSVRAGQKPWSASTDVLEIALRPVIGSLRHTGILLQNAAADLEEWLNSAARATARGNDDTKSF